MPDSPHILNKTQGDVLEDAHRFIMYSGGYGCGKTVLGCYWSILKSLRTPGNIGNIMSPTIKMLLDNILYSNLIPLLNTLIGADRYRLKKSFTDLGITLFNGSEIRLRAFDDEGKIRGADVNWIWLDEAIGKDRLYLNENRFAQIRARIRRGENQQFLVTTNPGSQTHFLYDYFIKSENERRALHYGSIYDNVTLGDEYIQDMESTYSRDELDGKWFRTFGVVYDQFDRNKHIKEFDVDKDWQFYLAIDFGFTNPFACLLIGRDKDDNIYIIDEYYKTKTTIDEHCKHIQLNYLDKYKINSAVADPASAGDIALMKKTLKIRMVKGRKNVKSGIDAVQKLFRASTPKGTQLSIHPDCTKLISELENYAWEEPREGKNEKEEPVKFMDHGLDALRYFVFTILSKKYNTVSVTTNKYRR